MFEWAEVVGLRALDNLDDVGSATPLAGEARNVPCASHAEVANTTSEVVITTSGLLERFEDAGRGGGVLLDWRLIGSYPNYNEARDALRASVHISGDSSACDDQKADRMTKTIRAQADALFTHGMTPSQAHKELSTTIVEQKLPSMKSFQNRHRYFRKCEMLENSKPEVMARLLLDHYYNNEKEESQYFSFGYNIAYGRPSIGYNGPNSPFGVGITTKKLLRQMQRSPTSFLFHWDSTQSASIHPVAFYVLGREAEPDYSWAIRELMTIYAVVVGEPLRISYVMSDAARAPALAIQLVKEDLGVEKTLMCFYHCMANVHKFLSGVSIAAKSLAFRHIYNMHYSRSEDEMQYHWVVAQESWLRYQELGRFVDYFRSQWIDSGSSCWQVYHAPSGFPTTNNPCEAFNKIFKDVYTKRQKHGL
ncbi:hypothetical protein Ae201684P_011491 [Aphanomyces euteiches]|nr:hypothetical protein Ae201684P_011491 [Aphanomyces euteiches]